MRLATGRTPGRAVAALAAALLLGACIATRGSAPSAQPSQTAATSASPTTEPTTPAATRPTTKGAARVEINFDDEATGRGSRAFAPLLGEWVVQRDPSAPSPPNVYAQVGTEDIVPPAGDAGQLFGSAYADYLDKIQAYQVFPSTVLVGSKVYGDVDVSVMFKPISGSVDQAGGIIFRIVGPQNYWIWRCNVLEQDCRLWNYQDGVRTDVVEVSLPLKLGEWHKMRVVAKGDHFQLYYDDRLLAEHRDPTFPRGRVGLWTKADSITRFDDFTVIPLGS